MSTDSPSPAFARAVAADADTAVLDRLCERLRFPVAKWRLVATAIEVALDAMSTTRLHRMPERAYASRADLDVVYRSTPAQGMVFPPPGRVPSR